MKHIDFDFAGRKLALSCTADAMFQIYDKFGYTSDILGDLHISEPTEEGWTNTCWLFCLFAEQGELQRRLMGYDAQDMITLPEVKLGASPAEVIPIRTAVTDALRQGFTRETDTKAEEVDMVLLDLEEQQKKKEDAAGTALFSSLAALASLAFRHGKPS